MSSNIFRKVSLERLSSPEQLDQVMQVTTPRSWLALGALALLLVTALVWGTFGSIPKRVQAMGVLINTGGVHDIAPLGSGQIVELQVQPGDEIAEGDVVARIDQPALEDRIHRTRARLAELETQHRELVRFNAADADLQGDLEQQQAETLAGSIEAAQSEAVWLREKLADQQVLFEEGLITKQQIAQTRQQLQATTERVESLQGEQRQLSIRHLALENKREQDIAASRMQMQEQRREIEVLEHQLAIAGNVVSTYSGRVIEVMAEVGSIVQEGRPILRVDRMGGGYDQLEAVIYVPGMDGKKVKEGMDVQISPTTVRREEFGFIRAELTQVSDFPATPEGMNRTLKNNQLVQTFAQAGAPYEAYATLRIDPETPSGFEWSSSVGPDTQIQTGTICTATVTVDEQRPIEMVVPALRKWFGV